ncbi:MAG: hypothetical protein C0608_00235 [Deltaproteobacteria bacterium]|nr:MAG: hypothetical protein C0608_00235 [Deltaproteobacteria bacterium]
MYPRIIISLALALSLSTLALAGGGIKGRASLGGVLVEDISVRAYEYTPLTFGPLTGGAPVAETVTETDGSYSLELKPGRYVVEAIKKGNGNNSVKVEGGDLYCLYSGSPVTVAAERWTAVGLYLVEAKTEEETPSPSAKLSGELTFKGDPVERAYLYAYNSAEGGFRGPAYMLQPVGKGSFSLRLPPGEYFLVARKRARGGAYGPMDTGDLFNFYPLNPVEIKAGAELKVKILLVERLSQLEVEENSYRGLKVKVLSSGGKPLSDHYVLAYTSSARSGPPAATGGPTDERGEAFINVPPNAIYLRARGTLGGPLAEEEPFADAIRGESEDMVTFKVYK